MLAWGHQVERSEACGKHGFDQHLATGPKTNVVIVAEFELSVQDYAREFAHLIIPRPKYCPHCEALDRLIGHGSYRRNVVDPLHCIAIRVKRFFCPVCHKTVSILPSFCLPWRHYQTATIQAVLGLRYCVQASWSAIQRHFQCTGVPTLTTCREWVTAFAQHSDSYLQQLLGQLACWQLAPGKLEVALEELASGSSVPQQLVAAVPHLVAFLRDNGVEVATGAARWLATLWQWGHSQKLGRLV